jgi:glutaredoxin 3
MFKKTLNKAVIFLAILAVVAAGIKLYKDYDAISPPSGPKQIGSDVKVFVYSKEFCQYCTLSKEMLGKKSIPYQNVDLSNNRDLHIKLANKTGQNTVPYIYINDKFIGGYTELVELDKLGKL